MIFDFFVLPFALSLIYLTIHLLVKYIRWFMLLPGSEKQKAKDFVLTRRSLSAGKEVIMECLLHRKMFRVNPLLGYMHMSFAFGWFMLILIGNIESRIASGAHVNPPYYPIFFKYFFHRENVFPFQAGFNFLMDVFLLLVLSGIVLAMIKRFHSRIFSMKQTTRLKPFDRIAMYSLWSIFPLRFFAESFTSATFENGHFLTHNAGIFFSKFLPVSYLDYPAWWAYSISLGMFFIALPYSRYMHIPTEVMLIFLRKYGIDTTRLNPSFSKFEVHSCSSCGVCIDTCQLNSVLSPNLVPPAYFLKQERHQTIDKFALSSCLVCGRCQEACPVGINVNGIRVNSRNRNEVKSPVCYSGMNYSQVPETEVLYFAGCMTHLVPSIRKAMIDIFQVAGISYRFLDDNASICCGRPLMLAGQYEQANELIIKNKQAINSSGARLMVVSCPICYKIFTDEYKLNLPIIHHTEFISQLIKSQKIKLKSTGLRTVYHDPCDLARGEDIYIAPREVLSAFSELKQTEFDGRKSLCCGGSLGGLKITPDERKLISKEALDQMQVENSDVVVTSCPLCKKTFNLVSPVPVKDIAEVVSEAIERKVNHHHINITQSTKKARSYINN